MRGLFERIDILKKKQRGLSKREKMFCVFYVSSADAKQSAISAGFKKEPKRRGTELLCREDICEYITYLAKIKKSVSVQMANTLLQRLAMSDISDAVSLLFLDSPTKEQLQKMDLLLVSEIKKPKDGALEIKFFDRFKALEKLTQENDSKSESGNSLYEALRLGAQNISLLRENDEL